MSRQVEEEFPVINFSKAQTLQAVQEESISESHTKRENVMIKLDNLVNTAVSQCGKIVNKETILSSHQNSDSIQNQSNTAIFLIKKKQLFEAYENLEKQKSLFKA